MAVLRVINGGLSNKPGKIKKITAVTLPQTSLHLQPVKGFEASVDNISALIQAVWIHGDDLMREELFGRLLRLNNEVTGEKENQNINHFSTKKNDRGTHEQATKRTEHANTIQPAR